MAARKPLDKGDDGSSNRYPDRTLATKAEAIPETWIAPTCDICGAKEWGVDHMDGDESSPKVCGDCYRQANG